MEGLTYFSKLSEGGSIEVYCHSWKGIKYSTFVTKEEKYQHPKTFLTPEAFNSIILENIGEFKAEYNESSDSINLRYDCMAKNYILLVLKRDQVGESDISVTLSQIDSRLSALEPFDVIHVAKYPSWRDFDEFMKLPGYKYIDASQNPARYLKTDGVADAHGNIPSDTYYLGKYKKTGMKYTYELPGITTTSSPMRWIGNVGTLSSHKLWQYRDPKSSYSYYDWHMDAHDICIEDRELPIIHQRCNESKEQNPLKHYFTQSAKMISSGEKPNINSYVLNYISTYITGWILSHHESFAMKDLCLDVFVDDNKCTFVLKAEKHKSMGVRIGSNSVRGYNVSLDNVLINGFKRTH